MRKTQLIIYLILIFSSHSFSQNTVKDTIPSKTAVSFKASSLIIPVSLITFGAIGIRNDAIEGINREIREEVNENIDKKFTIDDFSEYAPALSVYALNALGVKGKNDFKNRTVILATSFIIMSTTVRSLKSITKVERPDGSSKNSFPSGHTAMAFMGAEFLMQEYKDKSPWYGISGYMVATGTGLFRIYNNRHWLTDVAAGAGIGILSTKVAYWINPFLNEKLFKTKPDNNKQISSFIYPSYNGKQVGLSLSLNF